MAAVAAADDAIRVGVQGLGQEFVLHVQLPAVSELLGLFSTDSCGNSDAADDGLQSHCPTENNR